MHEPLRSDTRATNEPPATFTSELELIPRWSIIAAALAFVGVLYLFLFVVPQHEHHHPPPLGLRIYFALSWAALSALYVLMVGYILRDTRRRAMRARLWVVVCLVLPGGIGAVLYFLLRKPLIALCPSCGTRVQAGFHFCPQCAYQLSASCARCYSSMDVADRYCVECGHDRLRDSVPARLYAFREEA